MLRIYDSHERIPYSANTAHSIIISARRQDPRGLWRRTTLEQYRDANPAWETVLDLDELAGTEKENWVWQGYTVLNPS